MICEIPLSNCVDVARVDQIDFERVRSIGKWSMLRTQSGSMYACHDLPRRGGFLYMHRVVLDATRGMVVDHRNHNGLDNRRANLRLCTQSQNCANRRKTVRGASQFKGVVLRPSGRWGVYCAQRCVGTFDIEAEAARAYDAAALARYGEFALLNFPGGA